MYDLKQPHSHENILNHLFVFCIYGLCYYFMKRRVERALEIMGGTEREIEKSQALKYFFELSFLGVNWQTDFSVNHKLTTF